MTKEDREALEELARLTAEGKIQIIGVRVNVCGRCKAGTLKHAGTPDWMNRFVCDRCGAEVSR